MPQIHPTAIIDPAARLASGVVVGAYCVIGPDVEIGTGTILHSHAVVERLSTIGVDNEIFPFSVIGADPQDRKFAGERAVCTIGDRNKIREHVTIHRGTANGGGVTRLGSDNLVMVAAHIAHDCVIGSETIIANQVMIAGHVHVEDGANIGGGAGVHHFATVGRCAFVGGLARIAKDVPPFMIVEGNPAEVRGVNTIALQRRGYVQAEVDAAKEAYRRLYRDNGATMSEKIEELRRDLPDSAVIAELCTALEASAAGVHGRSRETSRTDDKRRRPIAPPA